MTEQVIQFRRALHQIPELDRDLPETMAYLRRVLAPLGCALSTPIPGALCAFFDFGKADAIAFRSDADALPIQERTGLSFASTHPGRMHACGHDAHMAMVLDLAVWLAGQRDLPHNVLLLFQPAEETTGGAKDLCQSGVLEAHHVQCVFGLHLWPELPAGVIASRKRELMSRSCEVSVTVTGRSSHIAKAQEGLDALAAGVEFYRRAVALEAALPSRMRSFSPSRTACARSPRRSRPRPAAPWTCTPTTATPPCGTPTTCTTRCGPRTSLSRSWRTR